MNVDHRVHFDRAAEVAAQATCTRAHCGAVVVAASGMVLGTGFNAPPLGLESQRMCDHDLSASPKPKSDRTCCVHAEWNAILNALLAHPGKVAGSTLYFMRVDETGAFTEAGEPYCTVCSRLALQAGITTFGLWNDGPEMIPADTYNLESYRFHMATR